MYQIDFQKPIRVHFIGIGGISMSGLARILQTEGFSVSGSDRQDSELLTPLRELGIEVQIGQRAENITDDIGLVVYTAAISHDNPEFAEAEKRGLPMMSRATLLGQIMKNYRVPIAVSGTHGKTTTTSMISEILMAAGCDPTLNIGGVLKSIDSNTRIGGRDYFVAEACEYTNSFLEFFPRIGIILNIEEDHLDFFKDLDDIRHSFRRFAGLLPEDGCLILGGSVPDRDAFCSGLRCRVVTFGEEEGCDYRPEEIRFDENGLGSYTLVHRTKDGSTERFAVSLSLPGRHNITNSLAALAASDELGLSRETALAALARFDGPRRRFEKKGELGGITIMDDYAHHPTEIRATLKAASNVPHKTLRCVFQPHTYTRTKAFLDEFADALCLADEVILTDIYAAREKNTVGISSVDLQKKLREKGKDALYFSYFDDIETYLLGHAEAGDLILTMGAGDVCRIGDRLLGK
ncbi:MAG: UDP-N-acetylmuramate--L-alanine ligase [Lachnospiraceae bacterium]|nr:UDP-N-acetylmuramate--L-alanine ligase [Lachnospiraceae bacterium]